MRARIDKWLSEHKPTGKKQSFEIRTHDGKATVNGVVYGLLAIESGTTKVTHVPSGYMIDVYMTATRARQAVALLQCYPFLSDVNQIPVPKAFKDYLMAISRFLTYQSNDDAEQRLIASYCNLPDMTTPIKSVNGMVALQNVSKGAYGAWAVKYLCRGLSCARTILDANDRQIKKRKPLGKELLTTVESIVGWKLTQAEESKVLELKVIQ
jgi:hypothetical protein